MNKKSKLKNRLLNIILIIGFLVGLFIFLYPTISNSINTMVQSKEIEDYDVIISDLSFNEYDDIIAKAQEYNETLVGKKLYQNRDNVKNTNYNELLSVDDSGIMGYLKISKIDVNLPIYHGSDASVLQNGIGHFEGTSLPVEGESVHTVLAGHTGMTSSKMLNNLTKLEIGDNFKIAVLNRVYTYEVDQILVVEPEDISDLEIIEGKQYATLITCTPYGINSHRLLVRGFLCDNSSNEDIFKDAVIVKWNFWSEHKN